MTPCTSGGGGKGKKSMLLGSCIARTNSEEDLQELAKRPISPGHRGTTWNGRFSVRNSESNHLTSNADDMCLLSREMDGMPPSSPCCMPLPLFAAPTSSLFPPLALYTWYFSQIRP